MKINFRGVYADADKTQMVGSISSAEIVKHFDESWIPAYQRERLSTKTKITQLKQLFLTGKKIPPVILRLDRKPIQHRDDPSLFTLEGNISVVDGQQRLYALKETGRLDYVVPAQVFVNTTTEETVGFFQDSNGKHSVLTLGDYIMSYQGPLAKLTQQIMREKGKWSFPMSRANCKYGLGVGTGAALIYWTYYKLIEQEPPILIPRRETLSSLFQNEQVTVEEVEYVAYAYKNLADLFVEVFGEFNFRDPAYQRTFFLAWNLLVVRNFMDTVGNITLKKNFRAKARDLRGNLFKRATFKQIASGGIGREVIEQMYDLIVSYFNYKVQEHKLGDYAALVEEHGELLGDQRVEEKIDKKAKKVILRKSQQAQMAWPILKAKT